MLCSGRNSNARPHRPHHRLRTRQTLGLWEEADQSEGMLSPSLMLVAKETDHLGCGKGNSLTRSAREVSPAPFSPGWLSSSLLLGSFTLVPIFHPPQPRRSRSCSLPPPPAQAVASIALYCSDFVCVSVLQWKLRFREQVCFIFVSTPVPCLCTEDCRCSINAC